MIIEIKVPALPESVADATVAAWHKKIGDPVKRDENIVDLETDKVVLEVPAPENGVLTAIVKEQGATVNAQEVIAVIETNVQSTATSVSGLTQVSDKKDSLDNAQVLTPSARRTAAESDVAVGQLLGTGKDGRITRNDVVTHLQQRATTTVAPVTEVVYQTQGRAEQRVPMSRLRARVAERLVQAQHNAAILTTFNEVNLQAIMDIRARHQDRFQQLHGVRLGLMSFFTKAVVEALKRFPVVNASIDGSDIVYHGYYDVGIAVSTDRGLVVPVLRNADQLDMAGIEKAIADFAQRARQNQITMEDMTGGTFTITNGGRFGSLLATPIINPPQTGILGMHTIQQRPIAENGQVVIRPMMYVALSYDHRLIDGKESVQFLVTVKQLLEDPSSLLLGV